MLGLIAVGSFPALHYYFGIPTVPQPHRYHLEVEMLIAVLLCGVFRIAFSRKWAAILLTPLLVVFFVSQLISFKRYADSIIHGIDIQTTAQYKVATWAREKLAPQDRMFVAGDTGFLFNLFSPILQVSSGHQPSSPNFIQQVGTYTIHTGMNTGGDQQDARYSLLWLRAFGVKAVLVPGPLQGGSQQPFSRPDKFEGVIPVIGKPGGWRVYDVGLLQGSLFRIVPEGSIVRNAPIHGLDVVELEPFVNALQMTPPSLNVHELHPGEWNVTGTVPPGNALSIAMNYDVGWRAFRNDQELEVKKDALGLMVIHPECAVPCRIRLEYDGGLLRKICLTISIASWFVLFWVIFTNHYMILKVPAKRLRPSRG